MKAHLSDAPFSKSQDCNSSSAKKNQVKHGKAFSYQYCSVFLSLRASNVSLHQAHAPSTSHFITLLRSLGRGAHPFHSSDPSLLMQNRWLSQQIPKPMVRPLVSRSTPRHSMQSSKTSKTLVSKQRPSDAYWAPNTNKSYIWISISVKPPETWPKPS